MIKVESITIKEFRGLRDFTINMSGKNFVICGPNGTGKSGVVDALEFGLTGNITRLTGKGSGNISVREHGPHVNSRTHPEKASVTLNVIIAKTGQKATITRSVKSPNVPIITPDKKNVREVFAYVEKHPEFTLSRREIIKYVLAEAGQRSKELQALLQLENLENIRSLLFKISNACSKEEKSLDSERKRLAESLKTALDIKELKQTTLLQAVNSKRVMLGLSQLTEISSTTYIRDNLENPVSTTLAKVPKLQAKQDLSITITALHSLAETQRGMGHIIVALKSLKNSEIDLDSLTRDVMLSNALQLFDNKHCPVCTTSWEPEKFREIIFEQQNKLKDAAAKRQQIEKALEPLINNLASLSQSLVIALNYARVLLISSENQSIQAFKQEIDRRIKTFRVFLPISNTIAALENEIAETATTSSVLIKLSDLVEKLPEPNNRDAARDYLTVGQERLEAWQHVLVKHQNKLEKARKAKTIFDIYSKTTDCALEGIYKKVEAEFRNFYSTINNDDESNFKAELTPHLGKLRFDVEFHGKGFFPPNAYHSEGHQDGMGLCLYLALMRYILSNRFTFAVLDDVLMSVDVGHRREVCNLLKSNFPDTQFVLTTHDPVWLKHMQTSKLVETQNSITFRNWHVDHGPIDWKKSDVWNEIEELVEQNEIRASAAKLRHYIEYVSAEWCEKLRGCLEYRSDGKYELGDLLPAAISAMNTAYKKAKEVANSWNNKECVDTLINKHAFFSNIVSKIDIDQWQINSAIHYNEWANLQREDFECLVEAYKELESEFSCKQCNQLLYVTGGKQKEALRCKCGAVNINLKRK